MPGIMMSIRIRLGRSARANVRPTSASVALRTVWPADSNRKTANFILSALSSTTRIFAMSGYSLTARQRPPALGRKAAAVELALLHDRRHIAVQQRAILRGDMIGGAHK